MLVWLLSQIPEGIHTQILRVFLWVFFKNVTKTSFNNTTRSFSRDFFSENSPESMTKVLPRGFFKHVHRFIKKSSRNVIMRFLLGILPKVYCRFRAFPRLLFFRDTTGFFSENSLILSGFFIVFFQIFPNEFYQKFPKAALLQFYKRFLQNHVFKFIIQFFQKSILNLFTGIPTNFFPIVSSVNTSMGSFGTSRISSWIWA